MAAFAAHEIFAEEMAAQYFDEAVRSIQERHRGVYQIGAQGPDLFFYNFFMSCGAEKKKLGTRLHEEGAGRYFACLLDEICHAKDSLTIETGISYFLGALTHYAFDLTLHPYVYARVGYDPEDPRGDKNTLGAHLRLEAAMDARILMMKREVLPSSYYPEKLMQISEAEEACLMRLLSAAGSRACRIHLKEENIRGSIWCMKKLVPKLYDHTGKKRKRMEKWEKSWFQDGYLSNFVVSDDLVLKGNIMNSLNRRWRHPWNPKWESTDSVWELYDKAADRYEEFYEAWLPIRKRLLEKILASGRPHYYPDQYERGVRQQIGEVVGKIGNCSYHSGISK